MAALQPIDRPSLVGVIVCHPKDFETLGPCLSSLRRHAHQVGEIVVISPESPGSEILSCSAGRSSDDADSWGPAVWVDEASFPFQLNDFKNCLPSAGWVLQQLLKLYAPSLLPSLLAQTRNFKSAASSELQPQKFFLIVDADSIWLQDVDFIAFDNDADHWVALLSTFGLGDAPGMRSEADLARYDDFVEAIVPGLTKRQRCVETAVVHHTVLERTVVDALFEHVERSHPSQPPPTLFWEHFRALALSKADVGHAPKVGVPVSEYELYFAFAWRFHRGRVRNRPLPFAVASDWKEWCRGSNYCEDGGSTSTRRESSKQSSDGKPPVTYVVSHSHLRVFAASKSDPAANLCDREGIVNERFLARSSGTHESTSSQTRQQTVLPGASHEKQVLTLILAQNGAFGF